MLRIVTDMACDLALGGKEEYQIDLIPLNIIMDGKSYLQGIELSDEDFYRYITVSGKIPSTSQPTPIQFIEFYRRVTKKGDSVLSIHVTQKLSGTLASAKEAAQALMGEINVIPYDSTSGTICAGMMCKEARLLERAGASLDEILTRMDVIRNTMQLVITLDNLKFAQMSGRVKLLEASIASLLQIKPIIELKDGMIAVTGKVRSRAKAIEAMLNILKNKFGDRRIHAGIVHVRDVPDAENLRKEVLRRFNCIDVVLTEVSITLATHFGPGALGLAAYPEK
jgi:DegV family protein with EDD domain